MTLTDSFVSKKIDGSVIFDCLSDPFVNNVAAQIRGVV